jgi:hypothetical protein
LFDLRALGLGINLAGQRHDAILDVVFDALVEPVLDEGSMQVVVDTLVQIRVHCLDLTGVFCTR